MPSMKRFWNTNFPGHAYNPVARLHGQPTDTPATLAPISGARTTNTPGLGGRSGGKTTYQRTSHWERRGSERAMSRCLASKRS